MNELTKVADWMKAKLDEIEALRSSEVTADAVLAEVIELFAMEVGECESEDAILYFHPEGKGYHALSPETSPLLYKWLVAKMREEMADEAVVYYFAGGESKTLGEAFAAAEQCGADLIEGFSRDGEMLHRYLWRPANRGGGFVWTTDYMAPDARGAKR